MRSAASRSGGEASAPPRGERHDTAARRTDGLIALAIAAVALAVFAPALTHGFLAYDDPGYVTKNPVVAQGLTLRGIAWAFTTTAESHYWEPLAWISHMADVSLFGMRAGGHHATSVALHALDAALLFLVLRGLTGARGRSALVAGLFALHPLHVESVAWIAERKDVLAAFFWIAAIGAYAGYALRPGVARYLGVLALFTLGLMSKPMVVTLPAVLLLLDVWPLGRVPLARGPGAGAAWRRVLIEKIPLAGLAAACGAVTLTTPPTGEVVPLAALGLAPRLANAATSALFYLEKMIWPTGLAVFYPYDEAPSAMRAALAASVLAAITIAALAQLRRRPWIFMGWAWYGATLLPVLGLVQVGSQARADRYTYIPLIGIFLAAVWLAAEAAQRMRAPRSAQMTGAIGALALCAALSVLQLRHWRSSTTLFTHALEVTTGNYVAHTILGTELAAQGRYDASSEHYRAALAIFPEYSLARFNLGQNLNAQGRLAEAEAEFQRALEGDPENVQARVNLAFALNRLGRPAEAAAQCERALKSDPRSVLALNNLAWIRATSTDAAVRDGAEAVRRARAAVDLDGGRNMRYLATLAASYAEAGRFEDALTAIDRAAAMARAAGNGPAGEEYARQKSLYAAGTPLRISAGGGATGAVRGSPAPPR